MLIKLLKSLTQMTSHALILVLVLFLLGFWRSGDRFLEALGLMFGSREPDKPQVDIRSLVVRQLRGVSDLTTAVFVMEAIVPTSQDWGIGEFVLGKTTLLYVAYGEVRAGIDLSQLRSEDVQLSNNQLRIRLPPPRILDSKIDINRSRVYDYNRGFLNLGPDVAPDLQMAAQQTALQKIQTAACVNGLLQDANVRAKQTITQLINTLGQQATIVAPAPIVETQAPLPGSCPAAGEATASDRL